MYLAVAFVDLRNTIKTNSRKSNSVGIFQPYSIEIDVYIRGYPVYGSSYIYAKGEAKYSSEWSEFNVRYYGDFDYDSDKEYLNSKLTSLYESYDKWGTIIARNLDVRVSDVLGDEVALYEKALRGDDEIYGSSFTDLISAKGGDDTVYGGSGDDWIYGENGNDDLHGELGSDHLEGRKGNDKLVGIRGADYLQGGEGNDELKAGNGRDIISGGDGSDTIYGGFGLNTFENEADGSMDRLYFKSDQWAENWLYGRAGNSPNGEKADKIEMLDEFDQIYVQGVSTSQLSYGSVDHQSNLGETLSGIGIYASGVLEAVYVGDNLSQSQIAAMTQGIL